MRIILTLLLSLATVIPFAQQGKVGVNTTLPATTLHVDGNKDNTSITPSAAQQANDVVVTQSGNVGVGTIAPSTKLHVTSGTQGAVRLVDGTQGADKVLTSDANGVATWQSMGLKSVVFRLQGTNTFQRAWTRVTGTISEVKLDEFGSSTTTNGFTLPAGKYMVSLSFDIEAWEIAGIRLINTANNFGVVTWAYRDWLTPSTFMIDITTPTTYGIMAFLYGYIPTTNITGNEQYQAPPVSLPYEALITIVKIG